MSSPQALNTLRPILKYNLKLSVFSVKNYYLLKCKQAIHFNRALCLVHCRVTGYLTQCCRMYFYKGRSLCSSTTITQTGTVIQFPLANSSNHKLLPQKPLLSFAVCHVAFPTYVTASSPLSFALQV